MLVNGMGLQEITICTLVDRLDDEVDEWIVNITGAEEDTTAPTFEVNNNLKILQLP